MCFKILFFLFLAVLDLHSVWAFSSRGGWGYSVLWCMASHHSGSSCCREHRLCGTQTSVVAHGLSCSIARGVFLDGGSNPCPLHWQVDSYPCTTREVLLGAFF